MISKNRYCGGIHNAFLSRKGSMHIVAQTLDINHADMFFGKQLIEKNILNGERLHPECLCYRTDGVLSRSLIHERFSIERSAPRRRMNLKLNP